MSDRRIILDNIYFTMYIDGEDYTNVHLDSKPKEIQEQYDSEEVLSHEKKLQIVDQLLKYFYNFWKLVESSGDTKQYTMYFNINLVMINIPVHYYIKIKNVLESLKSVIISNLKESYFKVENKLAKYFFDLILTFYTPIKPLYII
tara:strand:- start:212 stop:646 length:435 start_codon:yes stop_codon:yes gene_type:complete